jgi:hypothetical protein
LPKSLEAPPEFQLRASMKKVHKYVGRMLKLVITNKRIISQSQPKPNKITKIWTNAKTIQLQFVLQSLLICFPIVLLLLPLWCSKRMKCKSNDKKYFFFFYEIRSERLQTNIGKKKKLTKCIFWRHKMHFEWQQNSFVAIQILWRQKVGFLAKQHLNKYNIDENICIKWSYLFHLSVL